MRDFGTLLDEKLAGAGAPAPGRPLPPPAVVFGASWPFATAQRLEAAHTHRYGAAFWSRPAPRAPAAAAPARRLSPRQRAALECLRGFGAESIGESLSAQEVRTAFRSLARRFHPDRYPDADEAERAYLSQAFARITDAYRELMADRPA